MKDLKSIRLSKNFTQQEVADYCGIALRTYQRIERGERDGNINAWRSLAKLFNADNIDEILPKEIKNNPPNQ